MAETHSQAPFPSRTSRAPSSRIPSPNTPGPDTPGRSRLRRAAGIFLALVLLALLAAGAGILWLYMAEHAALPRMDGVLHVPGLAAPVTVRRDRLGTPHIDAANQDDLFVAQGYITAQDRLWQMDMFRRHADGDLAQILGPSFIQHDRIQRVLQIGRQAQRIYAAFSAGDRRRLDDYARGVNDFIRQSEAQGRLPAEFRLLMYKPQPWTGVDCVSVGLMEVQELDMHALTKLDRWYVSARLNNPKLEADLYPVGSWRDHPPTGVDVDLSQPQPAPAPSQDSGDNTAAMPRNEDRGGYASPDAAAYPSPGQIADGATRYAQEALGRPACAGCAVGSNEWVVAGKNTASGKPLLSNDMHIQLTEPNIWYMAALRAPGFDAAGVTLPGYPFIIAGHNRHVAWGFTDLNADVQDLYFEKLDDKGDYLAIDGQWRPLKIDREVIHVRGGRDVTVNVESTGHGPLVNALVGEPHPIALKWNLYDPALHTSPLYAMNVAENWAEFSAALAQWCWPAQNLVYSDDQGHIAYHAIGAVPLRPNGLMGLPIAGHAHEWQGYIPFDDLPHAFDPPSGFLATANSRVTTDNSPYPLSLEWINPYRTERIYKMLDGRTGLTPKDMLAAQTDIYSEVDQEFGQRFAYAIDHTPGADRQLRQAADLMRTWDGKLTVDSAAASVVDHARRALWPLILKPKLGNAWKDYHWGESQFAEEQIVMNADPAWLPPGCKDWNALLTEAVRDGMKAGKAPADVDHWKYGDWHTVKIDHPLAAFLPWIAKIADTGPLPESGDTTTVKQVSPFVGPSQRFTMDWSNVDGSTENIVLGESSDPLSPYYRNQWNAWYTGATFALPFTPGAVASQTSHTLRLEP